MTTAQEKLESARNSVEQAYKDLLVFLNSDTWGHKDYNDLFIDHIQEVSSDLLKVKRKLNNYTLPEPNP